MDSTVVLLVDSYDALWGFGYIVFGVHLLLLGALILKSDYVPRILGILLLIGGAGFFIEYVGRLLSSDFGVPLITNIQLAKRIVESLARKDFADLACKHWAEYV